MTTQSPDQPGDGGSPLAQADALARAGAWAAGGRHRAVREAEPARAQVRLGLAGLLDRLEEGRRR